MIKKSLRIFTAVLLFVLCAAFLAVDRCLEIWQIYPEKTVFKALASLCFIALGFFQFLCCENKSFSFSRFGKLILAALIISFFADIFIDVSRMAGFCVFFAAQICYLAAFSSYSKPDLKFFIITSVFCIIVGLEEIYNPCLEFGIYFIPLMIYMVSLFAAVIKAFGLLKIRDKFAFCCFLGMGFFGISDFLLQFDIFAVISDSSRNIFGIISNYFYYCGQLLMAFSLGKDFLPETAAAEKVEANLPESE